MKTSRGGAPPIAAVHDEAPELATTLWGAATATQAGSEYVIGPELDVYVTDLLEPLRGRPDFDVHWDRGRALSVDEAMELGLRIA